MFLRETSNLFQKFLEKIAKSKFDFNKFEDLFTFEERKNYLEKIGLTFLGEGSSRITYVFSSKKALKLAKIEIGIAQNEEECKQLIEYKSEFIPKYYENAPDFSWILVELVRPLTSKIEIESFFDISWKLFIFLMNNIENHSSLNEFLQSKLFKTKPYLPNSYIWEDIRTRYNKNYLTMTSEDIQNYFLKNKKIVSLVNFILSTDLDPLEFQDPMNFGKNSDGNVVLLDTGGTKEMFKNFYKS